MSESTDTTPVDSTDIAESSIAGILEHLDPSVSEALGHLPKSEKASATEVPEEETEAEPAPESKDSEEDQSESDKDEEENTSIEKLKKRVDKLTRKRGEAETEARTLREEKSRLESELASRAQIKLDPTPEDPLADIDDLASLDEKVAAAKKIRAWARLNPDGATITGTDGDERYVDRSEVQKYLAQSEALLEDHAPSRREYLKTRESGLVEAKQAYPGLFKAGSEEHTILVNTLKAVPALRRLPNYEMVIGDALVGQQLRLGKSQKSSGVKDANATGNVSTKSATIAPAVPRTTSSRPPQASTRSKTESYNRALGSGNVEDIESYFAAR